MRPVIQGHFVRQLERGYEKNVYLDPTLLTAHKFGTKGVWITHEWCRLEPKRRQYDFKDMDAQVDYMVANHPDCHIVFQISDQSYTSYEHQSPPDWLGDNRIKKTAQAGWVSATWHESVMDDLISLHYEVNHRYRDVCQFYGTATSETTIGINDPNQHIALHYTPEKRAVTLERLAKTIATAFPHKRLFFFQNFLPGGTPQRLLELCLEIAKPPYEVAIGGPDLIPYREGLSEKHSKMAHALETRVYVPIYLNLPDWVHKFCSAQYETFRSTHPKLVVELARRLKLQAIIWNNGMWEKPYNMEQAMAYFHEPLNPDIQPYSVPIDPRILKAHELLQEIVHKA